MLYPRAMGAAFADLPPALQRFHSVAGSLHYAGEVTVSHGGALARALAGAGSMPMRVGTMPFRLHARRAGDTEIWERHFGPRVTRSVQWLHAPGLIAERLGPGTFLLAPRVRDGRFHIPITGIRLAGLPLPVALMRDGGGVEWADADGVIAFDVRLCLRGAGEVIRYRGTLRPAAHGSEAGADPSPWPSPSPSP